MILFDKLIPMTKQELSKQIDVKVAFTSECNLRCGYCEGKSGFRNGKPGAMEDFRKTPLETGNISTTSLLIVLSEMHSYGIEGMSPTGGEPLLRPDWDVVVKEASRIGYTRIGVTTNGILLEPYIEKHGGLPTGLNFIKLSLDTHDPEKFREITGGGLLEKVIRGVRAVSKDVYVRANKVLLRSDLNDIKPYLDFCNNLGLKEVSFLDLVYYPNRGNIRDKKFFESEFVGFEEFNRIIEEAYGVSFVPSGRPGGVAFYKAYLPNGLKLSFKDSRVTKRDSQCETCPVYCQEGRCLIRIATDGNLTICPDYKGELPSINALEAIKNGTFMQEIDTIMEVFTTSRQVRTIEEFAKRHRVRLPNSI